MKFTKLIIKNYKGIQNITLNMLPSGCDIFTLIGLNESGKTSILEAISQFNPALTEDSQELKQLYSTSIEKIDPVKLIPKHSKSNFNDNIVIKATLSLTNTDKEEIIKHITEDSNNPYIIEHLNNEITISQTFKFENSDYIKRHNYITFDFYIKKKKGKSSFKKINLFSEDIPREFHNIIYNKIKSLIPSIYYFPTFIFNQPEKIKISGDNQSSIDKIYTRILENIAHSTGSKLDLHKHIIERALTDNDNARDALQSSLDQMSALITEKVFGLWHNILQGDFNGKEISLICTKDDSDDVYIQFQIKQGISRYNFMERSLGFRWFFSFLLFTLFNQKEKGKNILFLLDEPASNLHAKAQEELLKSFAQVTSNGNQIIYSTHSHYLINPIWLDQAYIVSNKATDYDHVDDRNLHGNENTLISIDTYRNYVTSNPTKTTYFQPILDKLHVTPSMLDCIKPSVLVEGKSDYLILEYARSVLLNKTIDIGILPLGGATKCEALISILKGWGVPFCIIFDDDKVGKSMSRKIQEDYILDNNIVFTLKNFDETLSGKEISSILSEEDKVIIKDYFQKTSLSPKNEKSSIQLFFSEHLAKKEQIKLSDNFMKKIKHINDKIEEFFKK